jgi:opacity protein-like surface antigen
MPRRVSFCRIVAVTLAVLAATAVPIHADITAFLGTAQVTKAPEVVALDRSAEKEFRTTKGLAVGFGLIILGFEFEYSNTSGVDGCTSKVGVPGLCAPSLTTGMGNVLLQTPHGLMPVQVYGTVGAGVYREHWDFSEAIAASDENDYGVGTNVGGGVKVDLVGPLRLRIDYRIFKLANGAYNTTPQRFYAGANLSF